MNKLNEDIDKIISDYLKKKAKEISVSEDILFKIKCKISKENKGEFYKKAK
jgi:hypothetical protein